ncbi:oligosaccharide flippase family protein [Clostridium sp. MCC353]|uniref:putative polysaccharide biosynthesis protein n=1 Tax=Clostridium sp. MCC353 TaxID=2592646 RepID=UPI001C01D12F|nr:polysaccharide biosynthesis protein [Clostridium sp. MCC353]MBT9779604.1 oligosaccharide flippase family protein [Clostridium sp. MCC353]
MEKNNQKRTRKKGSNFVIQGAILAAAGIFVRLIGMFYRIPLTNIIGDKGNGYYSSAFSIYSIMLIVSSYSLPVAVSKMVAARLGTRQYKNSIRILKASLFYATIVGGLAAAALWFGADFFANAVKMPFSSYAIRTLAPTIWIMAYLGVLRGYFQGHGTMIPTAISQIFEQIVNAVVSIMAASYLFAQGLKSNAVFDETQFSYAFGAAGGTIGTGAGAFIALLFVLFLLFTYRPVMKRQARKDKTVKLESYGEISYVLGLTVLPIVISSAIYNVGTVVDNYIFGNAMSFMGNGEQIATAWGVYMGKYHLLFNIPVAIANSLSSSLIPSLSRAVAARDKALVKDRVAIVIRFSMIVAIPSTVGLTILAAPICNLLFRGDNTELIKMTMTGSLAVVFFSLSTVTNGVLQGINRMNVPIRNALISLIVHVAMLVTLMYGLKMGIYSVVGTNIVFALMMCVLNARSIRRYLRYRQEVRKTFVLPTISAAFMGAAAYGSYRMIYRLCSSNLISLLAAIVIAVLVYGVLLIKTGCVDEMELYGMPGGRKLVKAAHKLHLL